MSGDISDRLEDVERRLETLSDVAVDNDAEIEEVQREVSGLRQDYDDRISTLERELEQVSQSLAFVEQAAAAEASSQEARAALCLQTLVNKAQNNGGVASMDYDGVLDALQGEPHRSTAYDIMETMARSCPAATHITEDRGADRNTRVELRTDSDDPIVSTIAGHRITVDSNGGVLRE